MDRAAHYANQTALSGHNYIDDSAYRASRTNIAFGFRVEPYDSTDKTIGLNDGAGGVFD